MKNLLIYFVLFIAFASYSSANETFAVQIRSGFGFPFFSSDFEYLNSAVSCGKFSSGNGFSIRPEIIAEKPVSKEFSLVLGFGFAQTKGKFHLYRQEPSFDFSTEEPVNLTIKNEIKTTEKYFTLSPGILYKLVDNLLNGPLSLSFNVGLDFPSSSSFTQKENIVSPQNAFFIYNGKYVQSRTLLDNAKIENTNSPIISLIPGITNQINLSSNLSLTQSVYASFDLNSHISGSKWKSIEPGASIGLRYAFLKNETVCVEDTIWEVDKPAAETPADTVIAEVPHIEESKPDSILNFKFENINPSEFSLNTGNELLATPPLLNVIFFDKGSSAIPEKYYLSQKNRTDYFQISPLEASNYTLLRIADLLIGTPNSGAVVFGFSSPSESKELSEARAQSIFNALVALGVNKNALSIKTDKEYRNLSNENYSEGAAENSRVEIQIRNANLLEYVAKEEFAELKGKISFKIDMENFINSSDAELYFPELDTSLSISKSGTYSLPINLKGNAVSFPVHITGKLTKSGISAIDSTEIELPTASNRSDTVQLANFKAVLRFDYNSSQLNSDNKLLLKNLVKHMPKGISEISILGSADRALGTAEYNDKLENLRAENTAKYLRTIDRNLKLNIGINENRFSDSTPEGRFLNRSVTIIFK